MKASVIICTYNREKFIGDALASVAAQNAPKDSFELIVVDNNSKDRSAQIIKEFIADHPLHPYRYISETRQGLSFARNAGIEAATGEIVIFIDDDAIARPDFVENITRFFNHYPEASALGGKVIPKFTEGEPEWLSKYVRKVVSEIDFGEEVKELKGNQYPFGANMSFRAEVFGKFGKFNTSLGRTGNNLLGGEEKDIFDRLKFNGGRIFYSPEVVVQHIIDPYRLTPEYIERFCKGVGKSERIRLKNRSFAAKAIKTAENRIKRLGSIVIGNLLTWRGEKEKGQMIKDVMRWIEEGYAEPLKEQ